MPQRNLFTKVGLMSYDCYLEYEVSIHDNSKLPANKLLMEAMATAALMKDEIKLVKHRIVLKELQRMTYNHKYTNIYHRCSPAQYVQQLD